MPTFHSAAIYTFVQQRELLHATLSNIYNRHTTNMQFKRKVPNTMVHRQLLTLTANQMSKT